jgi:hypothetical protein
MAEGAAQNLIRRGRVFHTERLPNEPTTRPGGRYSTHLGPVLFVTFLDGAGKTGINGIYIQTVGKEIGASSDRLCNLAPAA